MNNKDNKLYLFAGGGSGGHLYPGLAVAQALSQLDESAEIIFLCTERSIDKDILDKFPWPAVPQPVVPIPNRPQKIRKFISGWRGSVKICRRLILGNPNVLVLGLGGFASAPAMKVAARNRKPVAMLNPDAVPGKANRYCRRFANNIFVQWPQTVDEFSPRYTEKCIVSGCPIRSEFTGVKTFKQSGAKRNLVIAGGSLGGHNVNLAVIKALVELTFSCDLLENWNVMHITGKNDKEMVQSQYAESNIDVDILEFADNMPEIIGKADLAITRAGASTLAELTAAGVGGVLMPYPYHRDNHQMKNAQILADVGAAAIVEDKCNSVDNAKRLYQTLIKCMSDKTLQSMSQSALTLAKANAAVEIAKIILTR